MRNTQWSNFLNLRILRQNLLFCDTMDHFTVTRCVYRLAPTVALLTLNRHALDGVNPCICNVSCAFTWKCFKATPLLMHVLCFFGVIYCWSYWKISLGGARFLITDFYQAPSCVKIWAAGWIDTLRKTVAEPSRCLGFWASYKLCAYYSCRKPIRAGRTAPNSGFSGTGIKWFTAAGLA